MAITGVAPMPALRSTSGPFPGWRTKLPRGALASMVSPTRTEWLRNAPATPCGSSFTLMRRTSADGSPESE